jgi:hypothetical protein
VKASVRAAQHEHATNLGLRDSGGDTRPDGKHNIDHARGGVGRQDRDLARADRHPFENDAPVVALQYEDTVRVPEILTPPFPENMAP